MHRADALRDTQRRAHELLESLLSLRLVNRALAVSSRQSLLEGVPHKLCAASQMEDEEVVRVDERSIARVLQRALARLEASVVHLHRVRSVGQWRHRRPSCWLVEVPLVDDACRPPSLKCERRVSANKHADSSSTA